MIALVLLAAVAGGGYLAWRRTTNEERLARRLQTVLGRFAMPAPRRAARIGSAAPLRDALRARLEETLRYAGVPIRATEYVRLAGAGLAAAAVLGFLLRGVGGTLVLAALVAWAAWLWPRSRAAARAERFREVLPGALEGMAASLDAGIAIRQAVGAIAEDTPEPAGEAFAEVAREVELGRSLDEATRALAQRIRVDELAYLGAALRLAQQTGADLAGLLRQMAAALRDRHEARAELRALTAQGRLSAYILTALPWVIAAVFYLMDPQYGHTLLGTRGGWVILGLAVMLLGLGWITVQRVIRAV